MNIIFLSPHFPPQYHRFCQALKSLGVNVLGIGDASRSEFSDSLADSLTEYYRVPDMEDYDQVHRSVGYFIHRYGRIDRIESLNEHWLMCEAMLRTDFNVTGINLDNIEQIKLKSRMKNRFRQAGVDVVEGKPVDTLQQALDFVNQVGYPIIAKPDNGVGAASTHKVTCNEELQRIFAENPRAPYFLEEMVIGDIYTFDGLTDREGRPVFYTSHTYSSGVMEVVNNNDHVYYYSLREIPDSLKEAGFRTLKAFDVREQFFHFEYFKTRNDNRIIGLEVNMRPPGGFTTDMFNYANDIDIYQEWANILVHNEFKSPYSRKYHCCYVGRKASKRYRHLHEEIVQECASNLVMKGDMPHIFSPVMGDYFYIIRDEKLARIKELASFIHDLAS